MPRKTTVLDVLVVVGLFWLGGAIAVFLAIDPEIPLVFRLIGSAAWLLALPLYAMIRRGDT